MKLQILEGTKIFEDGQAVGTLTLQEGEKAGPFVIIESAVAPLKVVEPTLEEKAMTVGKGDSKARHLLTLEGRFQMADTKNANNRIYPNSLWERVFKNPSDVLKSVDHGEMLGEADHPKDGETRLSRVAGKVSKLWRSNENKKEIMGRFTVFDTEAGRNLLAIHEGGGRLGVSSRGQGSVVRVGGHDVVQEDFKLQTWDVVHNPSTPGAYPEEVTEAVADKPADELKETEMSRIADLEKRLSRLRSREPSTLSQDAVGLLREEAVEIQAALTEDTFDEPGRQARLATEATHFLRDLETVTEKSPPASSGDIVETVSRPDTAGAVMETILAVVTDPPSDVQEATKAARRAYREKIGIEGPLSEQEMEGILKASKALIERSASMDSKVPVIRATIRGPGLTEDQEQVIEATTERELRGKIDEALGGASAAAVEIDRSEAVYAECASRFSALLEAQTLKADQVVRDNAANSAEMSEMSAKLAGARQIIEGFAAKHNGLKDELSEALADLEAASTILEAVGSEFRAERLRGAVIGIAATNPQLRGLGEALSNVSSIEEAISTASSLQEKAQPPALVREPGPDQASLVESAVEKSDQSRREAEKKLTESSRPRRQDNGPLSLTQKVAGAFPNPRAG